MTPRDEPYRWPELSRRCSPNDSYIKIKITQSFSAACKLRRSLSILKIFDRLRFQDKISLRVVLL